MKRFNLSGGIGDELLPQNFTDMIAEAAGDDFELTFNSLGGYVSDGFAIYNMIRDSPGKKIVVLNGHTASIASYIAMSFDEIVVRDNTAFMIHNAWGGIIGNHRDLEEYADHLKNLTEIIANAYVKKTGKAKQEILDMMDKETWLYGKEIVDSGFADRMVESGSTESKEAAVMRASKSFNTFRLPVVKDDMKKAAALYIKEKDSWIDRARALVEEGKFNSCDDSTKPIRDGVVMRSALRRIVSRANVENKAEIAELVSMIDKKGKGDRNVTKEEILAAVKTARENNSLTLKEVASAMSCDKLLMTEAHSSALAMSEEFSKIGVKDPVASYKEMLKKVEDTEKARVENKIKETFDKDGLGKEKNMLLVHALDKLGDCKESELDAKIKEFKNDPIAKSLAGEMASESSPLNNLGVSTSGVKNEFAAGAVISL